MKKCNVKLLGCLVGAAVFAMSSCGMPSGGEAGDFYPNAGPMMPEDTLPSVPDDNYVYDTVYEQGFHDVAQTPSSYFSLDRNTAGYSLMRAQVNNGMKVAADSVRLEEYVNYFSYDYPAPEEGEVMRATAYLGDCPWNTENKLMTVGIKTQEAEVQSAHCNYVFLIDVSGSMSSLVYGLENQSCLDLVKYSINKLVDSLGEGDAVSIVTYANGVDVKLNPIYATEGNKQEIRAAVNALNSYGGTNGSGGLAKAYELAQRYKTEGGNNRIVLMSDGDFNVGISNQTQLKEFIQTQAQSGIYLSVIGVGMGNARDDFMQTLALNGNGNYAYIDSHREAEKVLCEELKGMLYTVASDVKAGVTFNADTVSSYRLLGYDLKTMSGSDFDNPEKDAGEIGSNLCVTAMYEVKLKEAGAGTKLADVTVRYKDVDKVDSEITVSVLNEQSQTEDQLFAGCVAEFALILRNSEYRGNASFDSILARLADLPIAQDKDVYRYEFKELVQKAMASGYYTATAPTVQTI